MIKAILTICMLMIAPGAAMADAELGTVVSKVQERYESAKRLHASFVQESTVRALDKVQRAEGEVWFKKPGKMRWNYYSPGRDEIVSDGKMFWYYDQGERQVIETPASEVLDTPSTTTFLQGLGNIKTQFKTSFSPTGKRDNKGHYVIDLAPLEVTADEPSKFTIFVEPETWLVKVIHLYDPFGNLTRVSFENVEVNKKISDSVFTFKVPKGVEVLRTAAPR